jgi:hypothetical protein
MAPSSPSDNLGQAATPVYINPGFSVKQNRAPIVPNAPKKQQKKQY